MSSSPPQGSYTKLVSQFSRVKQQAESGLYTIKRLRDFVKRLVEIEESYAKDLQKLVKAEDDKAKKTKEDAMGSFIQSLFSTFDLHAKWATHRLNFAKRLTTNIVKPLDTYLDDASTELARIIKDEKKCTSQILSMRSTVAKERRVCFQVWEEMLEVKAEKDAEEEKETTKRNNFPKLQKKLQTLRQKAQPQFAKFEQLRDTALAELTEYQKHSLPTLLHRLEVFESVRLAKLQTNITALAKLHAENGPSVDSFLSAVDALKVEADIAAFAAEAANSKGLGNEEEIFTLACDMPSASNAIMTDQWFNASPTPSLSITPDNSKGPGVVKPAPVPPPAVHSSVAPPRPETKDASSNATAKHVGFVAGSKATSTVFQVRAEYDYWDEAQTGDLRFRMGAIIDVISCEGGSQDTTIGDWWLGILHADASKTQGKFPSNYTTKVQSNASAAPQYVPASRRLTEHKRPTAFLRTSVVSRDEHVQRSPITPVSLDPLVETPSSPPEEWEPPNIIETVIGAYAYSYVPAGDPAVDSLGYLEFAAGDPIHVINQQDPDWWVGIHAKSHAVGFFPASFVNRRDQ